MELSMPCPMAQAQTNAAMEATVSSKHHAARADGDALPLVGEGHAAEAST